MSDALNWMNVGEPDGDGRAQAYALISIAEFLERIAVATEANLQVRNKAAQRRLTL